MLDIKETNLTEQDFDLILQGLEELPHKDLAGDMIFTLMMASKATSKEEREKVIQKSLSGTRDKAASKKLLKEEVQILQGKLLMLKRFLQQEGALKQAEDIVNPK